MPRQRANAPGPAQEVDAPMQADRTPEAAKPPARPVGDVPRAARPMWVLADRGLSVEADARVWTEEYRGGGLGAALAH